MATAERFIVRSCPVCIPNSLTVAAWEKRRSVDFRRKSGYMSSGSKGVNAFFPLWLRNYKSIAYRVYASSSSPTTDATSVESAEKMKSHHRCRKVKLHFLLKHQVKFGEHHAILGSSKAFGSWKKKKKMSWTESGWTLDLEANAGEKVEYKFVIVTEKGKLIWESGENRVLEIPREGSFEVICDWDSTTDHELLELKKLNDQVEPVSPDSKESQLPVETDDKVVESPFVQGWQGKDIVFMRSNEHASRESQRTRNTSRLEGPALMLVERDQKARNWWRKLDVVRELLMSDMGKENRLEALLNVAVYLKWINTGQIPCYEDGGHHRPNKHAEISRLIFRELERIFSDKAAIPQEILVVRKIHPCLPSFKSEFTASVPLTRIRDIAHRNDIPHELKQEIKHTIQNKLHRNAGPEDLIATEALLKTVTKTPGQYSDAFVEQLKIFYEELKDFFNAGSLTEQLEAVKPSLDDGGVSALVNFLASKQKMEELEKSAEIPPEKGMEVIIRTLHLLTGLRAILVKGVESGLRNDAPDTAIAARQKWRLSEIGLEDYSFVVLSRFVNVLEAGGGSSYLVQAAKRRNSNSWSHPIGALVIGIRQLGLSGWQQRECIAIENELQCWQNKGIPETEGEEDGINIWALRFKATLDRTRRLTEGYSDTLVEIFPDKVQKLGNALGIPENTVRTYTEAEIRASVVFQISKLVSLLLKSLRSLSGCDGWDTLVPGKAVGKLLQVDRIIPGSLDTANREPVVLVVNRADGDEEVKAAGENIVGIVLLQELPHLSHLGVRARQENVVFVTCEDDEKITGLQQLLNQSVRLEASAETVDISPASSEEGKELVIANLKDSDAENGTVKASAPNSVASRYQVSATPGAVVMDVVHADIESCGAKAASCGRLAELAYQSKKVLSGQGVSASFHVPQGKVIPFGAMHSALKSSGSFDQFQTLLAKIEEAKLEEGQLDKLCWELQSLVKWQRPVPDVVSQIAESFGADARLIARSSANVEDLAGMSGAGLYESIPTVNASDPELLAIAIARVWASLYTRRAVLSRRVAKVPQREAAMAVLVQEMLSPQLSFVLHTVSPIDRNKNIVEAEIAAGLGETLASGTRGTPWRLAGDKFQGSVKTLSFANFSEELIINPGGLADGLVQKISVDYSRKPLSVDSAFRQRFGQRLTTIGFFLEQKFGCPQDVEGCCLVGNDIYIVQARPQP